ncbi:MAG: UPF0280 family protein [Promethearchaeota archaeon]
MNDRSKIPRYREKFQIMESDCTIVTDIEAGIEIAKEKLKKDLEFLYSFVKEDPDWALSYVPIISGNRNSLILEMEYAAKICDVGPMAAVAGVLADRMQKEIFLKTNAKIVVVENGGEIIVDSKEDILIHLKVKSTNLQGKLGFIFKGESKPLGMATSSGQFGHSDSLGEADTVTIFAESAGIADAAATKICNCVKGENYKESINNGIAVAKTIPSIKGVFIVRKNLIGRYGDLPDLVRIKTDGADSSAGTNLNA